MKVIGYYNGEIGEPQALRVPFNDRALYFGDGVYDATYGRNGKMYKIDSHLKRFYDNLRCMDINFSMPQAELKDILQGLMQKTEGESVFIYWQASRGSELRNHSYSPQIQANLYILLKPAPLKDPDKKVKIITLNDTRYLHCNVKTLNLLPNILAYQQAEREGAGEAAFVRDGQVTECSQSNLFILKDGRVITPPVSRFILPGITRQSILNICKRLDIPYDEKPFGRQELTGADEIFLTSVSRLAIGVSAVDQTPVGGKANELFKTLQNELLIEYYNQTEA
jgi:D-alanine transaminase